MKTIPKNESCDCRDNHHGCVFGVSAVGEPSKPLKKTEKEGLSKLQCWHSNDTMSSFDDVTGHRMDLIEVCAPWDSPLTQEVESKGGKAMRLGLHNGYDLSSRRVFESS